MSKAQEFVTKARSYIGTNCTPFNKFFNNPYGTPWCAEFVSKVAYDVGILNKLIPKSAGAGSIPREGCSKGMGKWYEPYQIVPQTGDLVLYCWNGQGYYSGQDKYFSDHIEIVERVDSSNIYTIAGNANGSNTSSTVTTKTYPRNSCFINGYYRPEWKLIGGSSTVISPTPKPKLGKIATVQMWLNENFGTHCKIDNEYGSETKSAIVGSLQCYLNSTYKCNLAVDGIFGKKTKAQIRVLRKGARGTYVRLLQSALICHGLDTDGFDGIFGIATETAVEDWQEAHKLVIDGEAGKETFYSLLH